MRQKLRTNVALLRARKQQDEGSTLILVLVVILIGAFFVLPMMTYIMTVNKASRMRIEGANSSEVVRGGLRSVLYDPSALYSACAASGVSDPWPSTSPFRPACRSRRNARPSSNQQQFVPTDLRWALTTTMAGAAAAIPPPYVAPPSRPELDGTISEQWCTSAVSESVPCGKTFPGNASDATTYPNWTSEATTTSTGSKVFLPYLPSVIDAAGFAGGYNVDVGGGNICKVYFPGRYTDDVVITGTTPVYFVSGIYYFEKTLRFSGDAQVVIGAGATDGCIDSDAVAVADGGYADATSNGVGAHLRASAKPAASSSTPLTPSVSGKGVSVVVQSPAGGSDGR